MINTNKLKGKIVENGMTIGDLAKAMDISVPVHVRAI